MHRPLQLLAALLCLWQSVNAVTVNTTRGAVHGFHVDNGHHGLFYGKADVFLGIPYAQPPVGDLRFRLPRPICSYGPNGINATTYAPTCPSDTQFEPVYAGTNPRSEDCLIVNVFSPSATDGVKRPVIVWIHGGGFGRGSAFTYEHHGVIRQFTSRGAVVVVVQYRIGVLGFFTTFTPEFPANRGMFDMIMALRWVQEEITAFGGDPDRVTLSGESAGAIAVSALSLSPLSQGLFHQIIQHSGGTSIGVNYLESPIPNRGEYQANILCNFTSAQWATRNYSALVDCLYDMPWERFTEKNMGLGSLGTAFQVIIDGVLLPDSPSKLALTRPNYPILLGDMRDEAAGFFGVPSDANGPPADLSRFNADFTANYLLGQYPYLANNLTFLNDIILRVYGRGKLPAANDYLGWMKLASEAVTDATFGGSIRREANQYLANGNPNVYLFSFEYHSQVIGFNPNMTYQGWKPIPHAAEVPIIWFFKYFYEPALLSGKLSPYDILIADFIADMWTNFAKQGRPRPFKVQWPPVSSRAEMEFYRINAPVGRVEKHFRFNSDIVFNSVFPAVVGEFTAETMNPAAAAWLQEHYVPFITAEYAQNAICGGNLTISA